MSARAQRLHENTVGGFLPLLAPLITGAISALAGYGTNKGLRALFGSGVTMQGAELPFTVNEELGLILPKFGVNEASAKRMLNNVIGTNYPAVKTFIKKSLGDMVLPINKQAISDTITYLSKALGRGIAIPIESRLNFRGGIVSPWSL